LSYFSAGREKKKEEASAVTEQWRYSDITSGQRLVSRLQVVMDGKIIPAPYKVNITMLTLQGTVFALTCKFVSFDRSTNG
jgi:hypothetical protein